MAQSPRAMQLGVPQSPLSVLQPTVQEANVAAQVLAATSAAGGLTGAVDPNQEVVIRSPMAGLSTIRSPMQLPGMRTASPTLMPAEPIALPPVTGSVPGTAVVRSPTGVGALPLPPRSPAISPVPAPLPNLPSMQGLSPLPMPPSSPRSARPMPVGAQALPGMSPRATPTLPAPPSPLRHKTPSPQTGPMSQVQTELPGLPVAVSLGSPASRLPLPGEVTSYPLTGGVSPGNLQPLAPARGVNSPLPASPSVITQLTSKTSPMVVVAPTPQNTPVAGPVPLPLPSSASSSPKPLTPVGTSVSSSPRAKEVKMSPGLSPLPSPSRTFNTYAKAITENSIDDLLMAKGYAPLDIITLNTDKDKVYYIKAENPVGDIVFIQTDKSGGLTVQLPNRTVVKISEGSSIPTSVKISAMECAGSAVCGAAFQCNGELCILQRKDDGKIYQATYVVTETPRETKMTPFGSPVAFPVITLTEIESNNDDAIARVHKATLEIQQAAKISSTQQLVDTSKSINTLATQMNTLVTAYQKMHEFRDAEVFNNVKEIDRLRGLSQPLSEENQVKYKATVDKLFNLSMTFIQLVTFAKEYAAVQQQIDELTLKTNDAIYGMYIEARRSYDSKVSKQLQNATAWGLPAELNNVTDFNQLVTGQWQGANVPETPAITSFRRVLKS